MPASKQKKFEAKILSQGPGGAWSYIRVPFHAEKEFGTRARISVKGTINGFAFRSSIFPDGQGGHTMMINKAMQAGAKAKPGDATQFALEPDTEPRIVAVPTDFKKILRANGKAQAAFQKMSWSHKKAYVDWIDDAKRRETRARRMEKAAKMLAAGKKRM